ncbi:serine/threonine-protein kinase Nek1-like [Rhopilema esculentum]|uniref:serine/threonine-protein kinase Nek1-like n=1 Tax=Rhopilema esculentum TaxID=499914 RepID=UPI0031E3303B|eukprot:gene13001-3769_t
MENYEKLKKLGQGGCAVVYLVKEKENGRLFAMKEIQLDSSRPSRTKENVLREAKILQNLKHPHIVVFHDSFFDPKDEFLCILQDYCDGGSIYDKIQEAKLASVQLEEETIIKWFVQVVMAVQYLHSNRVLHRDIKTQNIFLMKNGIAKLGDFGISKVMDSTVDMAQTCVGTPCYLSPEMCQDSPYSSKADMWALGCVLYEMCMLNYAFEATSLLSLYYKIVNCNYEPISGNFSRELNTLMTRLLCKSPDNRPSATAILNDPFIHEKLSKMVTEYKHRQEEITVRHQRFKDNKNRPSSAASNRELRPNSVGKRCQSAIGLRSMPQNKEAAPSSKIAQEDKSNLMSAKDTGNYADDFVEESDSDYSDDFDEVEIEDDLGESDNEDEKENTNESGVIDQYPDDFEELGEEDEQEIEDLLDNAEDVLQGQEAYEDFVDDQPGDGSSNIAMLREHCREHLGNTMFNKVEQICKVGHDQEFLGSEFQRIAGSEMLDTCFLVNELVIRDTETT